MYPSVISGSIAWKLQSKIERQPTYSYTVIARTIGHAGDETSGVRVIEELTIDTNSSLRFIMWQRSSTVCVSWFSGSLEISQVQFSCSANPLQRSIHLSIVYLHQFCRFVHPTTTPAWKPPSISRNSFRTKSVTSTHHHNVHLQHFPLYSSIETTVDWSFPINIDQYSQSCLHK